jgi:hypothetical protein
MQKVWNLFKTLASLLDSGKSSPSLSFGEESLGKLSVRKFLVPRNFLFFLVPRKNPILPFFGKISKGNFPSLEGLGE